MAFYTYPPSGSVAGSAAIPAAGLNVDFSWRAGRLLNITFVVISGTAVFQYWDSRDCPSPIISPVAGTGWHETNKRIQRFQVTGSGTIAIVFNNPPEDIDVKALLAVAVGAVTISGTPDVNIKAVAGTTVHGATGGLPQQGNQTSTETEANPEYTKVATAGVFTILAGSNVLSKGTLVTYNLFVTPLGSPTSGNYPYICLTGHTSGTLYVFAVWGGGQSSSSFTMTASEKLDVVGYNGNIDSQMSYSWQATNP